MSPPNRIALEVCVETAAGLDACQGLVDRVELCAGLALGGLTPGPGLLQAARDSGLETHVLIRPRTGDFSYNTRELETILTDIHAVRAAGLTGVVIGALCDAALDLSALTQMIAAADGLTVTLHRAIDVVEDRAQALEQAVALGIHRILTSGGAKNALSGVAEIARLQALAGNRIEIMAGAGITSKTAKQILARSGVQSLHASCSATAPLDGPFRNLGFGETARRTDRSEIERLRAVLDAYRAAP